MFSDVISCKKKTVFVWLFVLLPLAGWHTLVDGVFLLYGCGRCYGLTHHHTDWSIVLSTCHRPHIGCQIFFVTWAYYSLHRSSSCTGPMAVDKELNTINDVKDGVYSGFEVWFSRVLNGRTLYKRTLQWMITGVEQWQSNELFTWYKALIDLTILYYRCIN